MVSDFPDLCPVRVDGGKRKGGADTRYHRAEPSEKTHASV